MPARTKGFITFGSLHNLVRLNSQVLDLWSEILRSVPTARLLADQDVGQTFIVKDKTIVAVEAMEGTDACILRAGEIAGPGCVIVKVARPKQDLRFDVPIVGPRTLESMSKAGATVLAMQEGKTLLLEKETLIKTADASDLCLTGV